MSIGVNMVFDEQQLDPARRGGQAVQLLADILPYVLAKYRLATSPAVPATKPVNRLPVRFVSDFQI